MFNPLIRHQVTRGGGEIGAFIGSVATRAPLTSRRNVSHPTHVASGKVLALATAHRVLVFGKSGKAFEVILCGAAAGRSESGSTGSEM